MFVLYIVLCFIANGYASNGRTVQCVIGRNVSFSFTSSTINKDAIVICHGSLPFLRVLPKTNQLILHRQDERLRIDVERASYNIVTVTISIMNVTENDIGIYKMEHNLSPGEVIDSVFVQGFDAAAFPRITMVPHIISDYTIALQCSSSTAYTGKFIWKLNGSVIESHIRYSQKSVLLVIRNVTSDDKYNLYTCTEFENGLESDPFKLNISGPNVIKFASNVTVTNEYESLNISCRTDCYPICTWNWYRFDLSSALEKDIATDNELHIKNTTREDAGRYFCKVYNVITDTSLEGFTYLDVLYGPDEIYINISDTTIQLEEFETIAIFCYADCFPPCQISWTETSTKTMRPGSELKLTHVEKDVNYTCDATNPRKSNAIISETIYIKVTSGTYSYKTTAMIPENSEKDFPFTRHFLYVALGVGVISSVGLFACLLHKVRACSHVRRASNSTPMTYSNQDGGDETLKEERPSGNYWTIVSNERGELSTAPETLIMQCNMTVLKGKTEIPKHNTSDQSISVIDVNVAIELDEYMDPIHSGVEERNDYIHPVHDDYIHPVNSDFSPRDHAAEM